MAISVEIDEHGYFVDVDSGEVASGVSGRLSHDYEETWVLSLVLQ